MSVPVARARYVAPCATAGPPPFRGVTAGTGWIGRELKEWELAYAAGFFDGEGWVGTVANGPYRYLRLHITQVDRAPLDWLKARFGGFVRLDSGGNGHWRHRWAVNGERARAFMLAIEPFVIVKRDRLTEALGLSYGESLPHVRGRP